MAQKDAVQSFISDIGDLKQKDCVRSFYKKDAVKRAPLWCIASSHGFISAAVLASPRLGRFTTITTPILRTKSTARFGPNILRCLLRIRLAKKVPTWKKLSLFLSSDREGLCARTHTCPVDERWAQLKDIAKLRTGPEWCRLRWIPTMDFISSWAKRTDDTTSDRWKVRDAMEKYLSSEGMILDKDFGGHCTHENGLGLAGGAVVAATRN